MLQTLTYTIDQENFNVNIDALNMHFDPVCVFDSNEHANNKKNMSHSLLIAVGSTRQFIVRNEKNILERFQQFYDQEKGWLFGYMSYDLKNEIENLHSEKNDSLAFPLMHFFSPKCVIQIDGENASFFYDDEFISKEEAEKIYQILFSEKQQTKESPAAIEIKSRIKREVYLATVNKLKQHIQQGDIYEINFCQEFFAENAMINTTEIYEKLNAISKAPFSAYCKFKDQYVISSSPERFLHKRGNILKSQPIKGTIKRAENKEEDAQLKEQLRNSAKDRNENVMIVDLVRNDLSRIAKRGTVRIDELFEVYSFKQVHQLISTVSCEIKENSSFTDILKATFPMGSMTGAPKINAMQLIDKYENTRRGVYSGAVGYITPNGDFDFSVVIRSILYDAEKKYLSFMVGSAITAKAQAEQEYEECLLKANAMFEVLSR